MLNYFLIINEKYFFRNGYLIKYKNNKFLKNLNYCNQKTK